MFKYIIKVLACSSRSKWETSTFGRAIMNACPITHLFNASAAFATSGSTAKSRTAHISSLSMRTCHFDHTFAIQIFFRNISFQRIECSQFLHVRFDSFFQFRFDIRSSSPIIVWVINMRNSLLSFLQLRFRGRSTSSIAVWILKPWQHWFLLISFRLIHWLVIIFLGRCIRWLIILFPSFIWVFWCLGRWIFGWLLPRWFLRLFVCWLGIWLLPIGHTIIIAMRLIFCRTRGLDIFAFVVLAIVARQHQWWDSACNHQCGQ